MSKRISSPEADAADHIHAAKGLMIVVNEWLAGNMSLPIPHGMTYGAPATAQVMVGLASAHLEMARTLRGQ